MTDTFFQVISVQEFFSLSRSFNQVQQTETVDILQSIGRVLAQEIVSAENLPPFSRSSMDGYAVQAKDTFGASETNPCYLQMVGEISIGAWPDLEIKTGECAEIVTGAKLPRGSDSVVMIERTQAISDTDIEIRKAVVPGENVLLRGEDCQKDEVVLSFGHRIRPQEVGLMAALGYPTCSVYQKPKVGIISSGNELVSIDQNPDLGQIRDVNSYTLCSYVELSGGISRLYGIIPDEIDSLTKCLEKARQECDLVLLSGGSSVGTKDLTVKAIERFPESKILAHGVSLSPGKPTLLSSIKDTPVIGLPGQVASAQIVMYILIVPLIRYLSGQKKGFPSYPRPSFPARLDRNIASKQGREDYIRVKIINQEKNGLLAQPIQGKSGLLKSLLQADGLIRIPAEDEGLKANTMVDVLMI